MYDGTIGPRFALIRELLHHEVIPYARLASRSAMSAVDSWFDAQEGANNFARRVTLWVQLTSYEHRSSDSTPLQTFFRWHVPLPRFKGTDAPPLAFEFSAKQQREFAELLQGTVDRRNLLKTLLDSAIIELKSELREPQLTP